MAEAMILYEMYKIMIQILRVQVCVMEQLQSPEEKSRLHWADEESHERCVLGKMIHQVKFISTSKYKQIVDLIREFA
jgi:hypothetical protein